ncbi:MAG: hypothetical protein RLZZ99_85 [Actinomycetota bacterium]
MIEDLRSLVECESPTEDLAACRRVVELASSISARLIPTKAETLEINGRPVFWLGSKKPEVVFLAHLDTVWPIGSFQPLWQIDGDLIRGPGAYDMKAGFIQALYAIADLDLDRVALIATTDEETGSFTSRNLIEEISKGAKAVLVLESAVDGKVKIGRKGTSMYTVTLHGRAAHAGLEPEQGINATIEMARIVESLVKLENPDLGTSVVPTLLKSGTTTNTVPALATLDVDSRSFSMAEMERVKAAIYALKPQHPDASIEITGGINRPPLERSATESLYKLAEQVAKELGMSELGAAVVGGASDGNFAGLHTQVLDGLGAVGSGAHSLTENVSAAALEPRSRLLTALVKAILK